MKSIKSKILIIISFIISLYFVIFYNFYQVSKDNYKTKNHLHQDIIISKLKENTIKLLDKMMFDYINIKDKLVQAHKDVKEYLKDIKEPLKLDLNSVLKDLKLNKNFDIYITDDNFVIRNATFKNDIGFDLSFSKNNFYKRKKLNKIGLTPPIFETSTKQFFSYTDSFLYPPNDKKIMQVSYNYGRYDSFLSPIKELLNKNNILDFKIYVKSGNFSFDLKIKDYKSYKPSLNEITKRIKDAIKTFKNLENKHIYIKYIDKNKKAIYFYEKNATIKQDLYIVYYILFDESKFNQELKNLNIQFAVVFILGIFLIILIYIMLQKIVIDRLDTIKKAILNKDIIKEIKGNDEIALLSNNYNQMFNEIQKQITQKENLIKLQDEFIKDAVHELNTPLALIAFNIDMLNIKNQYTTQIKSAIKTLIVIYEDLSFGIKQDRIKLEKENINLSNFLNNRIQYFNTIANSNNINIISYIDKDCYIDINTTELQRLIDNNISNGIKYSYSNSDFLIKLYKNNNIILEFITNSDDIKDKDKIFDRFSRESSKSGFGIGLNIVKKIANKYNIDIEIDRKDNKTIFRYIIKG